jgi:uncharacterized membrane protein YdfJ with MMPL/SSD domain
VAPLDVEPSAAGALSWTGRWGAVVAGAPRRFLGLTLVLVLAALPLVPQVFPHLNGGGFEDPAAESWQTVTLLAERMGQGPADVIALYQAPAGSTVDDVVVLGDVLAAAVRVEAHPLVQSVECVYTSGAPWLVSHDRTRTAVIVSLRGLENEKQAALAEVRRLLALNDTGGPAPAADGAAADVTTVEFSGIVSINVAVADVIAKDVVRGELIALPITTLVLLWVFRSVVAALVPLLLGLCANLVAFGCLRVLTMITDVSVFAANIVTLLALGLAIDCSLFVVTRFREELKGGKNVDDAVAIAMSTAGRASFFSAVVVALSMVGLCTMPQMLIRSLGYAGIVVVASTLFLLLTFLPALLRVIGTRIDAGRLPLSQSEGREGAFFHGVARAVMARPVVVVVVVAGGLLTLAAPFLRMDPSIPDYKAIPRGHPVRVATDRFNQAFMPNQLTPHDVVVVVDGDVFADGARLAAVAGIHDVLAAVDGVAAVQSAFALPGLSRAASVEVLLHKRDALDPAGARLLQRFVKVEPATSTTPAQSLVRFVVLSRESYNTTLTLGQVARLRALDRDGHVHVNVDGVGKDVGGVDVRVAGVPAVLYDLLQRLRERVPYALAFVALSMFLVLALAFRSVVVPIKAIVMNCLSMTASFGALVYVFQDGRFVDVFRYEVAGFTDASTPLLMFCLVFGLSMDYEVLLLARIREEAQRNGGDTETAVAVGLERTGRSITSAALLLIIVVGAFGFSNVLTMKMLGTGIAVSVFLDATIVRALLVPATMKLLGAWNWWPGSVTRR